MTNDDSIVFKYNTIEDGYDFYITDKWQKKYHFKIFSFPVPSSLLSEAIEIVVESSEIVARRYTVLSDFDADVEQAELRLKAKVKKSINQRHLTFKNGKLELSKEEVLRGTIGYTGESDTSFNHQFEIDGRRITIEQFVEMLCIYEGYNFKFKIYDPTDDID